GIDHVIAILPFPTARIIRLDIDDPKSYNNILLGIPYYPAMWPRPSAAPKRRSVSLISHFSDSDDAFALKKWVRHHSHMFDSAVIVNIGSPNSANEYSMKREVPSAWRIVNLSPKASLDQSLHQYQTVRPGDWHIKLNVSEYLLHPNLRDATSQIGVAKSGSAYKIPAVRALGPEQNNKKYQSILVSSSVYGVGNAPGFRTPYQENAIIIHAGLENGYDEFSFDVSPTSRWPGIGLVVQYGTTAGKDKGIISRDLR
ncbi:hypothetical protein AAMO2058_000916000, partial [Amorphochlora amoebiformis]